MPAPLFRSTPLTVARPPWVVKPPPWENEVAVIKWGARRFAEIRATTEYVWEVSTWGVPIPKVPDASSDKVHEMMLGLILAEENRKLLLKKTALPETEAGIREAALSGWTEPLALLIQQHGDPVEGFPRVERISSEIWRLVIEFVRGKRNPKTGKRKGERGPRTKTSAERRATTPTHDAADFVPVIQTYLREAYPKQDRGEINDRALEIAAGIKGARADTVADHQKRGRRDRHRAP